MCKFPAGVPENATRITFNSGVYYVWPVKGGKWQWQALDNCGEASSQTEACSRAREYIINDYDPLTNN